MRILPHLCHCSSADPPLGYIDDSGDCQLISPVIYGFQIGQNILDFPSGIEIDSPNQAIRDPLSDKSFFQKSGLCIGSVKNRKVLIRKSSPSLPDQIPDNKGSLLVGCPFLIKTKLISFLILCPEGFDLPSGIMRNHMVCRLQNILCRAVVLLQADDLCIRVTLFKIQYVSNIGTSKAIDGLIVITDHTEISVFFCQKIDKSKLRIVRVLILIHHDVAKTVLVIG